MRGRVPETQTGLMFAPGGEFRSYGLCTALREHLERECGAL